MIKVDCYVIMPNHVHMILVICYGHGRQGAAPTCGNPKRGGLARTISQIIGGWKRQVTIRAGFSPWQSSFHDHIIRNEESYRRIADYIENNPLLWENDCYFASSKPSPE